MTMAQLDDGTVLDVSADDVRRKALREQAEHEHSAVHLRSGDAELIIGFRGDVGMCYWSTLSPGDAVTAGGDNAEPVLFGSYDILVPPGAEIPVALVLDAADQFARTGERPTCVQWVNYAEAFDAQRVD